MSAFNMVNFLNQLEGKQLLSKTANFKIQRFLDYNYSVFGKLFLMLSGLVGVAFISAGIFAIISYNWDVFPKTVRGILSLFPLLVALYFYYKGVFEKKTAVWVEITSLFLFMMIGASIALVSSTYQLNGDFDKFIKVWLLVSVPIFYIGKASAFAVFYLGGMAYFAFPYLDFGFFGIPTNYNYSDKIYWFYFLLLAFLPHFYMVLNKGGRKQGVRAIYLGYLLAILLFIMLPVLVKGGWIFWAITLAFGFLIIGNRYYGENLGILSKPFQLIAFLGLGIGLIPLSTVEATGELFRYDSFHRLNYYETTHVVYYFVGLIAATLTTIYAWKTIRKKNQLLKMLVYAPILIGLMMLLYVVEAKWNFDVRWIGFLLYNLLLLGIGIFALAKGANERRASSLLFGLVFLVYFLLTKYFDLDVSFWLKGLIFIITGLGFFLINFIYGEELSYDTKQLKAEEKSTTDMADEDNTTNTLD